MSSRITITWTPAECVLFCERYGRVPSRELAALLRCSKSKLQRLANVMGFKHARVFFTAAEKARVKELHATHSAEQIRAIVFGGAKTLRQIYALIHRIGCPRKCVPWPAAVIERVRALHAEGFSDVQIAQRMPEMGKTVDARRRSISFIRARRLHLPVNAAAVLEAQRRAVRTQYERLGIKSGGELRRYGFRKYAIENGWPADLRPRHVQILNTLAAKGAMTRLDLHRAIGMSAARIEQTQRNGLASNDPEGSYVAHLIKRGLVASLKRAHHVYGQGKGHSKDLYLLTGEAIALLLARDQETGRRDAGGKTNTQKELSCQS